MSRLLTIHYLVSERLWMLVYVAAHLRRTDEALANVFHEAIAHDASLHCYGLLAN